MQIEIGDFSITPLRLAIFLALAVSFFWWCGFWPGDIPRYDYFDRRRIFRAWLGCSALFLGGAATACFGEHQYGLFPPTSLRPLLIVLGAIVMLAAVAWMHSLRSAFQSYYQQSASFSPTAFETESKWPNHALQRTRAAVTPAATDRLASLAPHHLRPQPSRPRRVSLSLGSLGEVPESSVATEISV